MNMNIKNRRFVGYNKLIITDSKSNNVVTSHPNVRFNLNNGPINNGPINNGPINNGPINNGPINNGPRMNNKEQQVQEQQVQKKSFDWQYYLDKYPDLRINGINTEQQAIQHWKTYGEKEGRVAEKSFNWQYYLDKYPDLRINGINTEQQAIQHWKTYGEKEGRVAEKSFDWQYYLDKYPDLRINGINTEQQAIQHWKTYGEKEGRVAIRTSKQVQDLIVKKIVKKIDLFGTKYIENIVNAIAKILRDCDLEVNVQIRNIENNDIQNCKVDAGRYLFICCPQTLLQSKNGPVYPTGLLPLPENKYFLYQFEQLDTENIIFMNPHFIRLVKGAEHTFDYSEVNLAYYPEELKDKVSLLMPPVVEWPNNTLTEKKYDILFCGYKNERREKTLNELRGTGYNVLHVTDVFGAELTKLISESRIFLNLHHSKSKSLETCRVNEAIMSPDTHIISENSGCEVVDNMYAKRVRFTRLEDICKTVKELLEGDDGNKADKFYLKFDICKWNEIVYTYVFIKIKLLNYNINGNITIINNRYLNNTINSNKENDGTSIRSIKTLNELVLLKNKNSLPYYINSIESFYKLYPDFDLKYYKDKYYQQSHFSDIRIMYEFHDNNEYKKRLYNDKIKIVIYTPMLYEKCGGIKALFGLSQKINNLKHKYIYAKIYCYDGSKYLNNYCNDFANPFEINDNTIVIYPEIISGNPLNAKHVIRWILLELGVELNERHYLNWNKTDFVYHWEPNTTKYVKQLSIPFIDKVFEKYNNNVRTKTCFLVKKGRLFHDLSNIKYIHPPDSVNIDNMTLIDIVKIFNNSHTFYCYDPNTFYILSATLCGCISVVYPIKNIDINHYYKNRIMYIDGFLFSSGIAYGNSTEQLIHAKSTINDAPNNINILLSKYDSSVNKFVEEIYDFINNNKTLRTIENEYY